MRTFFKCVAALSRLPVILLELDPHDAGAAKDLHVPRPDPHSDLRHRHLRPTVHIAPTPVSFPLPGRALFPLRRPHRLGLLA